MGGQMARDAFQVVAIQLFERPCGPPVQKPLPDRAEFRIGDFAQQVVREVILPGALGFEDAPLPQFVERARETLFIPVGRLRQQADRKRPPKWRQRIPPVRMRRPTIGRTCETITARTRGGGSVPPCAPESPARTVSTTNSGFPSVAP